MRTDSGPNNSALDRSIDRWLAGERRRENPRSVTGVGEFRDRRLHFKRSKRSVAAEVEGLSVARRVGRVGGVEAVTLVGSDLGRRVLVTEWSDGESLFNAIWNRTSVLGLAGRPARSCPEVLAGLARWLACFHRQGSEGKDLTRCAGCCGWLRDSLRSKLDAIRRANSPLLSEQQVASILDFAERGLRSDGWESEPIGRIHGDFELGNQLLRPDGSIMVLDFGDSRTGFVLEDVVRLWTGVWELSQCGRLRRRALAGARARILESYGLQEGASSTPRFQLLRVWNAVTRLCAAAGSRDRYDRATRRIHRRLARAERKWLQDEVLTDRAST